MKTPFYWPIRVYYEDTDAGGVVFYANYLKFMERARTEWLRELGFEQDELREKKQLLFVVASVSINFRQPAYFNDQLLASVAISKQGKSGLTFSQQILRNAPDGASNNELLAEAQVRVACVNAQTFKPCAMPAQLQARLKEGQP